MKLLSANYFIENSSFKKCQEIDKKYFGEFKEFIFISHSWDEKHNPDKDFTQFNIIKKMVIEGLNYIDVKIRMHDTHEVKINDFGFFYDYSSLYQWGRTEEEDKIFQEDLLKMGEYVKSAKFCLCLNLKAVIKRTWIYYEILNSLLVDNLIMYNYNEEISEIISTVHLMKKASERQDDDLEPSVYFGPLDSEVKNEVKAGAPGIESDLGFALNARKHKFWLETRHNRLNNGFSFLSQKIEESECTNGKDRLILTPFIKNIITKLNTYSREELNIFQEESMSSVGSFSRGYYYINESMIVFIFSLVYQSPYFFKMINYCGDVHHHILHKLSHKWKATRCESCKGGICHKCDYGYNYIELKGKIDCQCKKDKIR